MNVQVGPAAAVPSTVLAVSAFDPGGSSNSAQAGGGYASPGYDVMIGLPDGVDPVAAASQPVLVFETGQPAQGPAVPLSAVRTDGSGTFVYRAASDGSVLDMRVDVTVVGQAGGYAILADGALPVGTTVVLAGERT